MNLFFRLFICIFIAGFTLYKYIDRLNDLTELRLSIPLLAKEVKEIHEKNQTLRYLVESFESPQIMMELSRKPEFGYLHQAFLSDILIVEDSQPFENLNKDETEKPL